MASDSNLINLVCNLTGDKISIYEDYYSKKIKQYGSEENLKKFYISYKIITLLRRGYSLESIANSSGFTLDESKVEYYNELVKFHKSNNALAFVKDKDAKVSFLKTDPKVKEFIKRFSSVMQSNPQFFS